MKKEIKIKNVRNLNILTEFGSNKPILQIEAEVNRLEEVDEYMKLLESKNVKIVYEAKDEILDEVEKRYLREVIRPFRDKVDYIKKTSMGDGNQFIAISLGNGDDETYLPTFKKDEMYLGMESNRRYSLEELGL